MEQFENSLTGKFVMHEFPVGTKHVSVEKRMRVFSGQLIDDMIVQEDMNQMIKYRSYIFILNKLNLLYKLGSNNGTSYEDAYNFKHKVREQLLKLVFKKVR